MLEESIMTITTTTIPLSKQYTQKISEIFSQNPKCPFCEYSNLRKPQPKRLTEKLDIDPTPGELLCSVNKCTCNARYSYVSKEAVVEILKDPSSSTKIEVVTDHLVFWKSVAGRTREQPTRRTTSTERMHKIYTKAQLFDKLLNLIQDSWDSIPMPLKRKIKKIQTQVDQQDF